MKPKNSLTHELLRLVGSPSVSSNPEASTQNRSGLYNYASKNRMPLLYLEALRRLDRLEGLQKEYDELIDKYAKTLRAIWRVSELLNKAGIRYAFFKSIRPYQEVTVDIDILILGSEYKEVLEILRNARYVFLGDGPLSTTFRDSKARINLDIYDEVGVSHIIYLDKNTLTKFVDKRELSNGAVVRLLRPEADLLAIIAHSVVKEHMYVLSEYYTTLYYLAGMKHTDLNSFLSMVDTCKVRLAVKTHLGITALMHYSVHRSLPFSLTWLLQKLEMDRLEFARLEEIDFQMPFRYHLVTIIRALIEKLGEEKARRSFASQTSSILNLRFTSSLMKMMLQHFSRETY